MAALTQAERAEIAAVYLETNNRIETAKRLHHSLTTVTKYLKEYGLNCGIGGNQTAQIKATDAELIEAAKTMTLNEIAARYKMHPQSLPRRFKRLGVWPVGYGERKKAEKKPPKTYVKACPVCGSTFSTTKKNQVSCCAECRTKKWYEEKKAKRIEYRNRHEVERACAICGGLFYCLEVETRKTCSHECSEVFSRKQKRARHDKRIPKARRIDRIDIKSLYKRDNGQCYICGGVCNWNDWRTADSGNEYPGDTYPTIDHVLPVSKGGADSWGNVRLAHWACNLKKADGVIQIDPLTKEFAYSQKKYSKPAKKTKQYTLDGELLRIWDSTGQIKRETGLNEKRIQEVCRKNKTGYAFGYHWEYA